MLENRKDETTEENHDVFVFEASARRRERAIPKQRTSDRHRARVARAIAARAAQHNTTQLKHSTTQHNAEHEMRCCRVCACMIDIAIVWATHLFMCT